MASNSGDGDYETVILRCTDHHRSEQEADHTQIIISTAEMSSWDLPAILSHPIVVVKSNRNRLIEHSSYFRGLLCGSFSESCLDCISVDWNLETFMSILTFIHGFPVDFTSNNFLPLFEGALFFGVESLLFRCQDWLFQVTSSKELGPLQIRLVDLIHIWRFGMDHANDFIPDLCTGYLARNFMWAVNCTSFCYVPKDLLLSCIRHPDLTVDSEKNLAEALLRWLAANTDQLGSLRTIGDDYNILREIHISLLPLWFAAGKRRCRYFSKFADESIHAILKLMKHPTGGLADVVGDVDSSQLKIRLTQYTKIVDLSGCPQMKRIVPLLSMLLCSDSTGDRVHGEVPWVLSPTLSFKAVQELNISNCPGLDLEVAIECFSKLFPYLRTLKAAHFLNFKVKKFHQLVQKCPLLNEVDLKVDISPVIPTQVSIVSSSPAVTSQASKVAFGIEYHPSGASELFKSRGNRPLLSNITKLTLEGRVDVTDYDLKNISEFCASLFYLNLRGCSSVTDAGISYLILRCVMLHSLVACDTSFGQNSILALTSGTSNLNLSPIWQTEKNHSKSVADRLRVLHIGGCKDINETSLLRLMSETPMLKSLCLRETQIVDNALYSFHGCSLEMLDVSDTKVSGSALAHIISRNHGLKCLKAKGCMNLFHLDSKMQGGNSSESTCKEWHVEIGKTCKLDEITLGWGFSCFSLDALLPAIMTVRKITVGLGGSMSPYALNLLLRTCPLLDAVTIYFQVISDSILIDIMQSLRQLQVLALCYCLGELSPLSFASSMPNLRKLRLERVTPWMTNDDLGILAHNCENLVELSLVGCRLLNSDSQLIISSGWPGLTFIHLEDCGEVTSNGVASLFDCKALEDLLLRHNGPGIPKNFIVTAASTMPMLRKISLDVCDANEGDFDIPNFADRYFLSTVTIARCKPQRCALHLQKLQAHGTVHKETLVLRWESKNLTTTVIKERV